MSIVLLGSQGQLGLAIQLLARQKNIVIHALSRQQLDINDAAQLKQMFSAIKPKFLINAAAYTAVDLAERDVAQAMQLNAYAPEVIAKLCADYDCVLIHPSTDYIFDGASSSAYTEEDQPSPINIYGASKLLGEQLIQAACKKYIILRVSWVFSAQGKNFVKTILRLAQNKTELSVIDDQIGCPTAAAHIAAVIFRMINQLNVSSEFFGVYHYCDQPLTTWYHFAMQIAAEAKKYSSIRLEKIIPIASSEYPLPAKRPANSALNCSKIARVFNIDPSDWRLELARICQATLSELL
jgi:dTDP-4-dehydrorhamnose reductase